MRTTTAQGTAAPDPISRLRVALGTFVALEAEAGERRVAEAAVEAAWDAILMVERLMHPQRADSDLAQINQAEPGALLRLHPWTWEVLSLCRELHAASGGAFDPCLREAPGRMQHLELSAPHLARPHVRMFVDLGGVAKGYAVDRALEALRAAGCRGGLVNAGGDLAAFGERGHVIQWEQGGETHSYTLSNAALATSAAGESRRPSEHRGYYHGSDPEAVVGGSATVTAPRAAWADALTKCALLCAGARREALLARYEARVLSCTAGL